ncbi:MAG: radical SAM protein [Planctomycetes bacterium]|nr:radical SAM protein [Planctomycetota bacterium]
MSEVLPPHRSHPRTLGAQRYVYAVLSRRAGGISIGVNLSPHKACNFDCTYCQVDRRTSGSEKTVDLAVLGDEVRATFEAASSGALAAEPRFQSAPVELRRIVDVAFSGDGEPTNETWFAEAARMVHAERAAAGLAVPIRVITNATVLHLPRVAETLRALDAPGPGGAGLDVWAKLDAGTDEYYRLVDRTRVPFDRVVGNLLLCARERTITVQSLFARHHGEPPASAEIDAWAARLRGIADGGGRVGWVQVHTVSRPPAESFVQPLTMAELERIAVAARDAIPSASVVAYRGAA